MRGQPPYKVADEFVHHQKIARAALLQLTLEGRMTPKLFQSEEPKLFQPFGEDSCVAPKIRFVRIN
jgi:hypothetical protein